MKQEGMNQNDLKDTITSRGFLFVILWAVGFSFFMLSVDISGSGSFRGAGHTPKSSDRPGLRLLRQRRASPAPELTLPPGVRPVDVHVGIYINRSGEWS